VDLDEPGVELDRGFRERIVKLYAELGQFNYYELLGVERTAEKQTIRRAYFERAAVFHPDKHFRKELGSFKLKMEAIFGRLTQAYDTLRSRDGRAEYDSYLIDLDRTKGIEAMLREAMEEAKRAEEDVLRGATVPAAAPPLIDGSALMPSTPGTAFTPVSERARRDALAMRLMGGRVPPGRAASTMPPGQKSAEAVDALRRRYEERVGQARGQQAAKYSQLAHEAEVRGDVVAAANAYKVAASFAKDDAELQKKAQEIDAQAGIILAETYMRQATYEEREERWKEAARSWQHAVKGRPKDPHVHERAANALMRSSGDLHLAATLAQRAVTLDQANPEHRVTLANVYLAAGLALNARRELEAAAQLSPRNATIVALLKRLTRAG